MGLLELRNKLKSLFSETIKKNCESLRVSPRGEIDILEKNSRVYIYIYKNWEGSCDAYIRFKHNTFFIYL